MPLNWLLNKSPDVGIDNFFLRNTIPFKLPNDIITTNNVKNISNYVKEYYMEGWDVIPGIAKSKKLMTFDLSKPPYDNVSYFYKTDGSVFVFWLVKLKEFTYRGEAYSDFILTPFEIRNNTILPWVAGLSQTEVYRIDYFQKNSDLTINMNNIYVKLFSGEQTYCDDLTRAKSYLIISIVSKINSLLNCVNVIKIKNFPPKKLQKSRIRKGKLLIQSYYTLELKGISKKYESVMDKQDPQWANRIHLCRGHFKKYTEEKPLLGKYTGLWWWQPCVRGRNKKGVIFKDYELTK